MNGEDDELLSATVRGVKDPKAVGQVVYRDDAGHYTLAGDDRNGEPGHVVVTVQCPDLGQGGGCYIREISEVELAAWRRKWAK